MGGAGVGDGAAVVPGVAGGGDLPCVGDVPGVGYVPGVVNRSGCPRPWTSICNVGIIDIPVNNTMDNTITPNFDILYDLRCCLLYIDIVSTE